MSKLGLHFQTLPSWHSTHRVPWVKMIDPPSTNPWPWSHVLGRVWIGGDHVEQGMIWQGKAGARDYYRACLPAYERAPYVHAWEGPNEPHPLWDANFRRALRVFTIEWARLMHAAGRLIIAGCLSVGWPDVGHAPEFADMLVEADYLGLREYGAPAMWDNETWHCLRYRRTVAELQAAGARIPPIIIGECGVDGGVLGTPTARRGWRSYATRGQYEQQLAWYDARLCEDDLVWCATPFVSGPAPDWLDFDIDEGLARWIASWHTTLARPAPPAWTPGQTPPAPSTPGDIDWTKVEAAIGQEAQKHIVPLSPGNAFEVAGAAMDLLPACDEFDLVVDGVTFRAQAYREAGQRQWQYIVTAVVGQWDKLHWWKRQN